MPMDPAEEERPKYESLFIYFIRFLIRSDELIIQIMAEICHPLGRRGQFSLQ